PPQLDVEGAHLHVVDLFRVDFPGGVEGQGEGAADAGAGAVRLRVRAPADQAEVWVDVRVPRQPGARRGDGLGQDETGDGAAGDGRAVEMAAGEFGLHGGGSEGTGGFR